MALDLSKFKQKFIDEANTLLTNLDNTLLELEKAPDNVQYINEAFRAMHTIKGASGMYGFEKIMEITHEVESLFDIFRQNKENVPQALIEITFSISDHIRALLEDEAVAKPENIENHTRLVDRINDIKYKLNATLEDVKIQTNTQKEENTIKVPATWNILFYPHEEINKRAINLVYTFQDLFQLGDYKINTEPLKSNGQEFWSIFLITSESYDEIESALMFVMDFCKINKVADFNIFEPSELEKRDKKIFEFIEKSTVIEKLVKPDVKTVSELIQPVSQEKPVETPIHLPKQVTSTINVDASKLDILMYLVSELVTTRSELKNALLKNNIEKANDASDKIEKLTKSLSDNALSIRLVSLQDMLSRFKRLIRDLSKQLEKPIEFVTIGEDTELDKNIIDNIGEPIMHLIRNCIDHGIESPEKRIESGKDEMGIIKFEALKQGNYVYINISDDGKGIDTNYIYNKAIEKGFISKGANLTEKQILDLIFLPGFSTAQSLSNVSGRGVGMDIVLRKIHEIRGEISIHSTISVGTTFTLKLQQSVSIVETLLVKASGYTYAIPIEDIEACILEESEQFVNSKTKQIGYNDDLIPYIDLRNNSNTNHLNNREINEKLIIIKRQTKTYAIIADKIIGEFQAVIKPLGQAFSNVKFLSGASLLGDGGIALLVDTDKLWSEINAN